MGFQNDFSLQGCHFFFGWHVKGEGASPPFLGVGTKNSMGNFRVFLLLLPKMLRDVVFLLRGSFFLGVSF